MKKLLALILLTPLSLAQSPQPPVLTATVDEHLIITAPATMSCEELTFCSWQLQVSGGVGPYIWEQSSGQLPKGMMLTNEGLIVGTPYSGSCQNGICSFNITVIVRDMGAVRIDSEQFYTH
jgi:hypothetical protein